MKTILFILFLVAFFCGHSTVFAGANYPVIQKPLKDAIQSTSTSALIGSESLPLVANDYVAITLPNSPDKGILARVSFRLMQSSELPGSHGNLPDFYEPRLTVFNTSTIIKPTADIIYYKESNTVREYGGTTTYLGQKIYFFASSKLVNSVVTWSVKLTWGTGADFEVAGTDTDRTQLGTLPEEPRLVGGEIKSFVAPNKVPQLVVYQDVLATFVLEQSHDLNTWTTCACTTQTVANSEVTIKGVQYKTVVMTPTVPPGGFPPNCFFRLKKP